MVKSFVTKKPARDKKKRDVAVKTHKRLDEFYSPEQVNSQKVMTIEEQIFEHLKEHTKKVLKKNHETSKKNHDGSKERP